MKISSTLLGAEIAGRETTVAWRRTTNYAASLGDGNVRYFDDTGERGLVAPPMFAVALTWPLSLELGARLKVDAFPSEVLMTQVHYSEHLRFHRLVRPGDHLKITGKVAGISSHRSGTHLIVRYDAADAKGEKVFTEHSGAILRGVACLDGDRADDLPRAPEYPGSDCSASPVWEAPVSVTPFLPYLYDGCTGIVFPIHTSPRFARQVGLPGIIVQGTATLALAVREIVDREAGGDPGRLKALGCRFSGMVPPGSGIRVRLVARDVKEAGRLFFEVINDQGQRAISHGYAELSTS
jgi:acyl dehydratase